MKRITSERLQSHEGYVQHVGSDRAHFGVCAACGWDGPDRPTVAEAEGDVQGHVDSTGFTLEHAMATQRAGMKL